MSEKNIKMETLIDSGAGGEFIDQNYARTLTLPLQKLIKPIPALNFDRTLNKKGIIKHYINLDLDIFGQKQTMCLLVTGLGKQKMILGFPWLQKHNPIINWQTGTFEWQHAPWKITFRKQIKNLFAEPLLRPTIIKEEDPDEWMTQTVNVLGTDCQDALISPLIEIQEQIMDKGTWINPKTNSVWICSKTNLATDMAIAENLEDLTDKKIVPPEYHEYLDIFNKE